MRLEVLTDGRVRVVSSYSPALVAAARATPGMTWEPHARSYAGSRGAVAAVLGVLRARGLSVPPDPQDRPLAVHLGDMGKELRPYQLDAVTFLLSERCALLADAMGVGKSAPAIVAARLLGRRTLIVCPHVSGALPRQWVEYVKRWWPDARVQRLIGVKPRESGFLAADTNVCVVHYEVLHAWVDALRAWGPGVVVLDECHALMSDESRRTKAARAVSQGATYRWGLSGTPITNRPRDAWSVVDVLRPGEFGAFFKYALRYCDARQEQVTPEKRVWKFDGASNLEELHARLRHFTLRRTAADVSLELPPKTRDVMRLDVPSKARVALHEARPAEVRRALDRAADAKLPHVVGAVLEAARGGARVVAFTWRRAVAEHVADAARAAGLGADLVHGGVSTTQRLTAIERARTSATGHVLACTIDAASTGIDLSYANVADFVELTWEPHELLQAEARLHRFGATKPVLVRYWVARGTGDELVADVVVRKLDVYERALGATGESLASDLEEAPGDVMAELVAAIEAQKRGKR